MERVRDFVSVYTCVQLCVADVVLLLLEVLRLRD